MYLRLEQEAVNDFFSYASSSYMLHRLSLPREDVAAMRSSTQEDQQITCHRLLGCVHSEVGMPKSIGVLY